MANIFTAWRRQFLGKRGLETPTGHPIYSYRLSAEEFADLEELLKTSLEMYLRTGTLGRVTQQIVYFPSMFVLYAAEWWRRRYDGSGWWECAPKTGQISSKIENRPIGAFQVHELLELDRRTIAD